MNIERHDWTICGRLIGKASGWDQADTFALVLYDFVPSPGVELPMNDISIDLEEGTIRVYDDAGNIAFEADLLDTLAKAPKSDWSRYPPKAEQLAQ